MSGVYAGFEPEGMVQYIQTGLEASPQSSGMGLDIGDLVESIPDQQRGTVEAVACGPRGCFYGVRFANHEAAVRSRAQLRLATSFGGVGVGKNPFSDTFAPGELKAAIAALNGRVRAFGNDVSGTPTDDERILDYRSQFTDWFNQYFQWFASVDSAPLGYTWTSARDRARAYSKSLLQWINEWLALGGKIAAWSAVAPSETDVIAGKIPFGDLFTPGEMKADIAALNGRVKAFGDDVSGTPSDDEKILAYRSRFAAWFNQYFEWFRGIDGTFSYSLNSTRDRARQYSDELTAWVNEWKGMGGKVVSEIAIAPPEKDIGGRGREQRESGSVLETLTTGALIVGGGALGILLLSKLMDSRRGRAQAQEG